MHQSHDELIHYGMPRRSGRYPWGSGEDPYQRTGDFLSRVEELKKKGWTETPENIQKEFGLSVKQYRNEKSICTDSRRMIKVEKAEALKEKGLSNVAIGKEMGINESSVRELLNQKKRAKMLETQTTVDFLKQQADDKKMIDVGKGLEKELNISKERLDLALYYLETREGYPVYGNRFSQATNPGQMTTQKVLCVPGTKHNEIYDLSKIQTVHDYVSRDGGKTYEKKFTYPSSLDSKRLKVRTADDVGPDGVKGVDKDGLIELRRGVPDLSLGTSTYAQVRILVDGKKYLKGMAVYSDNMPDGVDVVFNTNKSSPEKALKDITDDPANPFGSLIKDADQGGQYWYNPKTGEKCSSKDPGAKLGLINKRADEGDWSDWQDTLPSQFLAKQNITLIKKQLGIAKADKLSEYEETCALNNPTVKKHLLEKFADNCDAAAVDLKAAALPGQKYHAIIPINALKDNEVYAPNYDNGTKLALVRYPHAGTFEIPILTVNNKNKVAIGVLKKNPRDAIGVTKKVADRLSGADFDGDTVMCIPTHDAKGKVKITSTKELPGFENGFDTVLNYGPETYAGRKVKLITKDYMQNQMGVVSNLIMDMTIQGANPEDMAKAVKHSMVIIDSYKHKLDYKQSEKDNEIARLKKDYQGHVDSEGRYHEGASTIFTRAKGRQDVLKRQGSPYTNLKDKKGYDPDRPEGAKMWKTAQGKKLEYEVEKVDKRTGEVTTVTKQRRQQSTKMAETDDAMTLVSDFRDPKELCYADYANSMKALANRARLEVARTGKIEYSKTAAETYSKEVASLKTKLHNAELNIVRERAANRIAADTVQKRVEADPTLKDSKKEQRKIGQRALTQAREDLGSKSRKERNINITDREWEAIQAGAINETTLKRILNNTDIAVLREKATPKNSKTMSQGQINKIKAMSESYTTAQIAEKMNCSPSTVSKILKGE